MSDFQNFETENNELINIEVICFDPNILEGDNSHHFLASYPSSILVGTIKNQINQFWSEGLRGDNYILKMNDEIINEELSIRENNIRNGTKLIINRV